MASSIDTFNFAAIRGMPGILVDTVEVIERPNVRGSALRGMGRHGQRFSLTTVEDLASLAACRQQLAAYEALVGADPVRLVISDVDYYANDGILIAVLGIRPIRMVETPTIVGGVNNLSAGAVLYTAWDVKIIEV